MKINENFQNLKNDYLFAEVAKRVNDFKTKHPEKEVLRLGIGDVTLPHSKAVVAAIKRAADEMGEQKTFRGYGEYRGYEFLHKAIAGHYSEFGVEVTLDEIFVNDGAKSDLGNIFDIFGRGNTVLIPSPVYPAYLDANIMEGNTVKFVSGTEENGFLPAPPKYAADIIYICSPNNPTGAVYDKKGLAAWIEYARSHDAVILFDAAYEAFIADKNLPHSIFEVAGARECAIEFCSFSKTAGFTGTRCGYTVIPKELSRGGASLNAMWLRRQTTKYNGAPYIVQRAAEAVFSAEGQKQAKADVAYYMQNASVMAKRLKDMGIYFTGGLSSPYVWMKCPKGLSSWEFFDKLLTATGVVGTPGEGFGEAGKGFFRFTAFGKRETVEKAMDKLEQLVKKL